MNRILVIWLVLSMSLLSPDNSAAENSQPVAKHWSQPYFAQMDVLFHGAEFHARWDIDRCACGDVLIRSEQTYPQGVITGEQLLVNGRALLTRGFVDYESDPGALLDSPTLMLQLLFVLMQKLEPGGPSAVGEPVDIVLNEQSFAIELDTGIAHGRFPAPWSLQGNARRLDDGTHRFELAFAFENRIDEKTTEESAIQLSGFLDYQPRDFPLSGVLPLAGWELHDLRPDEVEPLIIEATTTLAELRELAGDGRPE